MFSLSSQTHARHASNSRSAERKVVRGQLGGRKSNGSKNLAAWKADGATAGLRSPLFDALGFFSLCSRAVEVLPQGVNTEGRRG